MNKFLEKMTKLQAAAEKEMSAGMKAFLKSTQEDITKFAQENDVYFSKRQFSDIMKRAEKSMSPLEVRGDLYKVSQINCMTGAFIEQLKENNIPTSRRFEDLLAQNIEWKQLAPESVQNILDRTIEKAQSQKFEIEKKSFGNEELKMNDTNFEIDGMKLGRITEMNDAITAYINTKKESDVVIFEMSKDESGNYKNKDGKVMTEQEAVELAEKSCLGAINTNRIIDVFQSETYAYIDEKKVAQEFTAKEQKREENLAPAKTNEKEEIEMEM